MVILLSENLTLPICVPPEPVDIKLISVLVFMVLIVEPVKSNAEVLAVVVFKVVALAFTMLPFCA